MNSKTRGLKTLIAVAALAAALLLTANAHAQTTPIDVEIGYRWLDVNGNRGLYRTQVNEREGVMLRALSLSTIDFDGHATVMDHFRLDVDELGAGPASSLRLESGLANAYRFNLRFRRADAFSALPSFANPLLGRGITPGQHTYDRTRDMVDADVELLRWSAIRPFVGYSWNRFSGPGTSTWHVGQDEFLLTQSVHDLDRELRVGAGFEYGKFQGQVTQGWRAFRGRDTLSLASGANAGNNPDPILGHPITATTATRDERTDVDTPFTSLYVTAQAMPRLRFIGDFSRFAAESDASGSDAATGSFASFALSRFFGGVSEESSARAKNTTWRGGARAEFAWTDKVDVTAGYRREHRELDGSALIRTLYLQSLTFSGVDPRDVQVILNATNALERAEDVIDASVVTRPTGPLFLRAGVAQSKSDVTVTPDLSEIVIDGGQGGTFTRRVRSLLLDGSYTRSGVTLAAALRHDGANDPIMRTDFLDRDRYRVRAGWKAPRFFRAAVTADETRQNNDRTGIDYHARLRQYTAEVEVAPLETLALRASTSQFRANSSALFREPENFTIGRSINLERGRAVEGGASLTWRRIGFDGGLSRYENNGSLPFTLDRSHARVTVDLYNHVGVAAEWAKDEYSESNFAIANYDATRYGLFLRLTR